MTDIKKIIEDLEYARYHCTSNKGKDAINDALDLINRQQAGIERLKKGWKADVIETQTAKAEAIKEFADRLQIRCIKQDGCLWSSDIGAELKEMVGEE